MSRGRAPGQSACPVQAYKAIDGPRTPSAFRSAIMPVRGAIAEIVEGGQGQRTSPAVRLSHDDRRPRATPDRIVLVRGHSCRG